MKVAIVTAVVGLASLALCAPIALDDHQSSLENITDDYLFNIPSNSLSNTATHIRALLN
ncbi:hypothetical protein P3342_003864 [Pyrenophora teres f. teres]|nr:hypothetical protein P3342_003864 [Pyrenophora teres f. teres]